MCCQRRARRCWGFSGARNRAAENAPERGQRGETGASRRVSLQGKETFLKVAEQPLSCLPPASPSVYPRDAVPHSRRNLPSAVLPPGQWDSAGREYLHEAVGEGGGVWQRSGAVGHCLCRAWVLLEAAHRAECASYGGCGTRLVPCEHSKQPRGQRLRSTVCRMSFGGLKLPSLSRPLVSLVPLPLLQSELCRLSQLSLIGDTPVPVPSPCLWPFPGLSPVASHLSWAGEPGAGHSTPRVARWGRARAESLCVPLAVFPGTLAGHWGAHRWPVFLLGLSASAAVGSWGYSSPVQRLESPFFKPHEVLVGLFLQPFK